MAKKRRSSTKRKPAGPGPLKITRRAGRPALFEDKTQRPCWTLSPEAVGLAAAAGERIGCSTSDAVEAAIRSFDAESYAYHRASRKVAQFPTR